MNVVASTGGLDADAPNARIATVYWPGLTAMYGETPPYATCLSTVGWLGSPNGYM